MSVGSLANCSQSCCLSQLEIFHTAFNINLSERWDCVKTFKWAVYKPRCSMTKVLLRTLLWFLWEFTVRSRKDHSATYWFPCEVYLVLPGRRVFPGPQTCTMLPCQQRSGNPSGLCLVFGDDSIVPWYKAGSFWEGAPHFPQPCPNRTSFHSAKGHTCWANTSWFLQDTVDPTQSDLWFSERITNRWHPILQMWENLPWPWFLAWNSSN